MDIPVMFPYNSSRTKEFRLRGLGSKTVLLKASDIRRSPGQTRHSRCSKWVVNLEALIGVLLSTYPGALERHTNLDVRNGL